jgi:hypothetical protein
MAWWEVVVPRRPRELSRRLRWIGNQNGLARLQTTPTGR